MDMNALCGLLTFMICMVHSLLASNIKGSGCIDIEIGYICCWEILIGLFLLRSCLLNIHVFIQDQEYICSYMCSYSLFPNTNNNPI
jgi:hypothetical protein